MFGDIDAKNTNDLVTHQVLLPTPAYGVLGWLVAAGELALTAPELRNESKFLLFSTLTPTYSSGVADCSREAPRHWLASI